MKQAWPTQTIASFVTGVNVTDFEDVHRLVAFLYGPNSYASAAPFYLQAPYAKIFAEKYPTEYKIMMETVAPAQKDDPAGIIRIVMELHMKLGVEMILEPVK